MTENHVHNPDLFYALEAVILQSSDGASVAGDPWATRNLLAGVAEEGSSLDTRKRPCIRFTVGGQLVKELIFYY